MRWNKTFIEYGPNNTRWEETVADNPEYIFREILGDNPWVEKGNGESGKARKSIRINNEDLHPIYRLFVSSYGDIVKPYIRGKHRRNIRQKLLKLKGITVEYTDESINVSLAKGN